jgi:hypothetical protein
VTHIFVPTDPEMQERVGTRIGIDVLAPGAPILTKDQIAGLSAGDEDTEWVLNQGMQIIKPGSSVFSLRSQPTRPNPFRISTPDPSVFWVRSLTASSDAPKSGVLGSSGCQRNPKCAGSDDWHGVRIKKCLYCKLCIQLQSAPQAALNSTLL